MINLGSKSRKDPKEEIWDSLKRFLDKKELRHIKPASFTKGVFFLNVDSPSRMYQLNLKKEAMFEYLENKFKQTEIKDIRFRIGKIK